LWFPPECSVGSVYSDGRHVSVGYYSINNNNGDDNAINVTSSPSYASMWTCTGQLAGNFWMQLETNRKTISQGIIVPSRCLGALLAFITVQTDNQCLQATEAATTTNDNKNIDDDDHQHCIHRHHQNYQQHSLEEMTKEIIKHVRPPSFAERLNLAFQVWKDCIHVTWKDRLSSSDYEGIQNRLRDNQLKFRLSCVRQEPIIVSTKSSSERKKKRSSATTSSNGGEIFTYSRQELCHAIMGAVGPEIGAEFLRS
jgi:hypothetical protein